MNDDEANRSQAWAAARNLLCVRLDQIGDVVMTGPALRALKPGRRVTLLTSPAGAQIAALMPEVDEVLVYESPWMKASPDRLDAAADRAMIDRLREARFGAAVVFTVYSQSPLPAALLCLLSDIPLRLAHCRENPYALLTDWAREREPDDLTRHEVRRQLDLVATVGARADDERLRISVPALARERVRTLVPGGDAWALVHPGSTAASRRYPPGLFAEVCRTLVEEHDLKLVFSGDERERDAVDQIRPSDSLSLAGELDLAELSALIELAPVLVAGNTGPVHLAAAVGTPVVDLYALTNPQHTPWRVRSAVLFNDVPCRWCYRSVCPEGHHLCLAGVPPRAVVDAVLALLRGQGTVTSDALSLGSPG
jgi:ADP-heptose:LPS heptosyltransferase